MFTQSTEPVNQTLNHQAGKVDFDGKSNLALKTCGEMFSAWYQDQLYLRIPTTRSGRNRFSEVQRFMAIMKCFLPSGTIIRPRPTDSVGLCAWMKHLEVLQQFCQ